MQRDDSVAESVRNEVLRHEHGILRLDESARKIACKHKYQNDFLIRQALLREVQEKRQIAQL